MTTTDTTISRTIDPEFETIGRRKRLLGYRTVIRDGDTVIYDRTHDSYLDAERAGDLFVYELLSSEQAHTATALDGAQAETDDEPDPVNWTDRDPDAKSDDVPPPYMRMPEGDILDADGKRVSLVDIRARLNACVNCGGAHSIQLCPEVLTALFRPEPAWKDIALGRELCRMKWRDFRAFAALLLSVPSACLTTYAESYIAFIRDYNPDSRLTIEQVLAVWSNDMQRGGERRTAQPAVA